MIELLEGKFFKTFIAVIEEKSFSRAADKLGYVQSTVTTHIQLLEQACNQKLFHRLSRGVKPTEAGLKLAKFAYQFIHLGMALEEAMSELDQPQGTVHIRMQESFFLTRMSPLIQEFIGSYPKIKVRLGTGFHRDILNQVLEHAVDFGIVPQNPNRSDVIFYPLVEEKLVFIASDVLVQKVESHGLDILNGEIVISFGTSCLYHTRASKLLQEAGIEGNNALEFPSIEMIKQSVKCGIGFALIPEMAVKKELEEEQFKALPLCPPIFSTHGLIVHKDRELSFPAKLFKSKVIDYFSSEMTTETE
ncbi:LysR family transcriptional regulator [Bacillus sp. Xin]|uniref:LysR family transcriptional regulator n=1 Tax=unclassified Bacillus (in: firmicutes) TaxID=185979 RepID=UPI00157484EE|nr:MULTISPECIES: LysR family transcriptional regulator [unclassified Bacillus (in: firmicutes)]MBC6971519.1 LysR family transcriptional regulator [Bacillus sp. Xin]NSW39488.1 LysR family transcriptional regulator [Bacillus sp. Xin1]